ERMLRHFGPKLEVSAHHVKIKGGQKMHGIPVQVPSDPSTAAFWIGAASIIPGAKLDLKNISLNPTRTGLIQVLQRMGAHIKTEITHSVPEPVGDIQVTAGTLR